eukprot:g6784.t1
MLRGAANEEVREEAAMEVSRAWLPARSNQSSNARKCEQGAATTSVPGDQNAASAAPAPAAAAAVAMAPFLSVRTAFDLYLKALKLPRGSLVVCSALTIPDMVTIFEEHGLVPVPVDLDPDTLAPQPGAIESEVESRGGGGGGEGDGEGGGEQRRVRAIYVAHVFGAQVDMTHVAGVAARHGLLLWEDCAQVFTGLGGYLGHQESDATFFSFGVIKRATALGGGVAHIRDAAVLSAMLRHEAEYPTQSTVAYLRRVLKCSMLHAFSTPLLYGIIIRAVRLLGIDHDEVVMKLSKGFPKKGLMKAIRHRACVPLLQMLAWRIRRYSTEGVEVRLRHCNRMLSVLEASLARREGLPLTPGGDGATQEELGATVGGVGVGDVLPGIKSHRHTLWLYPVMVEGGSDRARDIVEALLRAGFDATRASSSLMPIDRCTTEGKRLSHGVATTSTSTPRCCAMMDSLVYLPLANNVPDSEVDRLALTLARELSSYRFAPGGRGLDGSRTGGNGSRERSAAARSLIAFAFRLDVMVVSTLCLIERMAGGVVHALLCAATAVLLLSGLITEGSNVVMLVQEEGGDGGGYFPLAGAVSSATRLAVEHLQEAQAAAAAAAPGVTLSTEVVDEGVRAVADLCVALDRDEDTVAVLSPLGTYSSALLGSMSDHYLHLPVLSVAGTAARSERRDDAAEGQGGYLLHVQPAIVPQMQALVRLILDMKLARDALDGRSETTERVWLVHTSDTFGTIATAAFNTATKTVSVALPETDTSTETDDGSEEEVVRATVEVAGTVVLAASSEATFDSELALLVAEEASIVVLLAEGFDGAVVRTVLDQANEAGLADGVQWFLPNTAAFDHIFDRNSTYRDADLAFDMRGMLGVRACTPRTGDGSSQAEALSQEWVRLDPDDYPGAGPDGVTADGLMDPLLAFAYDSVFVAAAAASVAQEAIVLAGGGNLTGIALDSCPFPANGPWANGTVMRDAVLSASATLVGATGPLSMSVGEDDDGRDVDTATFCAVNLRPHASDGARFEVISTLDGGSLENDDGVGFQAISPFQEAQTFPQGALTYPTDTPVLQGRHMNVVMRRDAPPFVFVEGDGTSESDFTGITPEFLKKLSEVVGFTYTLSATPAGTTTPETIEMVRNGSADMTGSWITITSDRSEYVSFTYPYFDLGIAFVYKPDSDEGVDFWKAFAPFEPSLWFALFVALLVTVFLLWLFEGAKNDQFSRGGWNRRHRTATRGLSRSVYVTSSLMMSQLTHKPETLEGYLLTLGWLFTSFVLAASYTAELASFLTAVKLQTTSLSVAGLKSGEIPHSQVALLQGGNTQVLYERDFKQCTGLVECSLGVQPQPCYSTKECFTMVMNGSALTTLADSATAEYELQNDFCGLTTLPEVLYPQHYGLVLPFGSELTEELMAATLSLREDGTLGEIEDTYLDPSEVCVPVTVDDGETANMTVGDVSGVFFVLSLFVAASTVSWFFRRSPWAKSARERRKRANGGDAEQSLMDSYAKMSRRQQKSFAMQATVAMLQESRMMSASSKTLPSKASEDEKDASAGGDTEGVQAARGARPRGFQREIAEGRPVVALDGGLSGSKQGLLRRSASTKTSLFRRMAGHRGGSGDSNGSNGRPSEGGGMDAGGPLMSLGGGGGSGGGGGGDDGSVVWSASGSPQRGDLAARSAASKWLSKKVGGGGGGRGGSVGARAAGAGSAPAAVASATSESVTGPTMEEGRDPAGAGAAETGSHTEQE